jgi:hypothetical protein
MDIHTLRQITHTFNACARVRVHLLQHHLVGVAEIVFGNERLKAELALRKFIEI